MLKLSAFIRFCFSASRDFINQKNIIKTIIYIIIIINPFTGIVALLHHARPLERATSHYCTTGSRGLFTAYLDLLVLRFSVHYSSAASLYILFHHHVYIFTYVSVAVRKTCLFVPRTCCDASTCSRTTQKRLHTSSKAI